MDCLTACFQLPLQCVWVLIRPLLSMLLGIIGGSILSVAITTFIFVLTLVRTPLHIWKMICVTLKSDIDCFPNKTRATSVILRGLTLLSVPVFHILFLLGVTLFSATIGTLYYIGKSTQVVYRCEYRKSFKKLESNARLEPKSFVGKYVKNCQDYMEEDGQRFSYPVIITIKGLWALLPAAALAGVATIPFSLAITAITLYRTPINMYKTIKIALTTVLLKWDLRIIVLLLLPLVHTMFPLVAWSGAMVFSFFWTWQQATEHLVRDENPIAKCWPEWNTMIQDYHSLQKKFVTEHCRQYDHASGIPYGWDGESYGIAITRILRFQRDLVIGSVLTIIQLPVVFIITLVVSCVQLAPACIITLQRYVSDKCCRSDASCSQILGVWPFHLLALCCLPFLVLLAYGFSVPVAMVRVPFSVFDKYWEQRSFWKGVKAGWSSQFLIIRGHDDIMGEFFCQDFKLFSESGCCSCFRQCANGSSVNTTRDERQHNASGVAPSNRTTESPTSYWDRFSTTCIHTTAMLLQEEWISRDDVKSVEPATVQSIPAVAILTILVDSIRDSNIPKNAIKWEVDGHICHEQHHPHPDGVYKVMWPMVQEILYMLQSKKEQLVTEANVRALTILLCANQEQESPKMQREKQNVLKDMSKQDQDWDSQIRTKLNRLVLAILRVRPYQQRMDQIYNYEYGEDVESPSMPTSEAPANDMERETNIHKCGDRSKINSTTDYSSTEAILSVEEADNDDTRDNFDATDENENSPPELTSRPPRKDIDDASDHCDSQNSRIELKEAEDDHNVGELSNLHQREAATATGSSWVSSGSNSWLTNSSVQNDDNSEETEEIEEVSNVEEV